MATENRGHHAVTTSELRWNFDKSDEVVMDRWIVWSKQGDRYYTQQNMMER